MKMKFKCAAAIATLLVGVPLISVAAPDAKKAEAPAKEVKPAKEGIKPDKEAKPAAKEVKEPEKAPPSEAEIAKARKTKKPFYIKAAEALDAAWACQQPLAVFFVLDDSSSLTSQALEKKMMGDKRFRDDYAKSNLVLLKIKLKPVPVPRGRGRHRGAQQGERKIEMPRKDADFKLVEQFGLDPKRKARTPGSKYDDYANYPSGVVLAPNGKKMLFRMASYDKNGGFGVWLSTFDGQVRGAKIEPEVSNPVQKILDNPTEPKKWK